MKIYKQNQGKYIRVTTAVTMVLMSAWGAYAMKDTLEARGVNIYLSYGIPTLALAVMCMVAFLVTNRPKSADFLIATESEMKKVAWSSKREIIGSTKVVIIATLMLAALLFMIDTAFLVFFRKIGVTLGR